MLKFTSGWNDGHEKMGNGSDAYSFAVLPAGLRKFGTYSKEGEYTGFWIPADNTNNTAYGFYVDNEERDCEHCSNVYLNWEDKNGGFSVRCVKD